MRLPSRPRPTLLALLWAARAAADEPTAGPPVTLPPAGETPAAEATAPGHRSRPGEEVAQAPGASGSWPLAGFHGDRFYLRDPGDHVRLFPGGLVQIDTRAAFGRGVDELTGERAAPLQPRVGVRRARLDLGGQIHGAWSFYVSGEFAGGSPRLEYALIDLGFHRLLHVTLGQQLVPFSQANRTYEPDLPWFERPLAVRFALPRDKDLGVMAWGETRTGVLAYEAGVFGGDGPRGNADRAVDVAGRVTLRPLAATRSIAQDVQIGASALYGVRQIERVTQPLDALTTEGGFAFWTPQRDDQGTAVVAIPSGLQRAFGGEVRVPVSRLDLRFEFLHARRHTRESEPGREAIDSARFGTLRGSSFYVHLGVWMLGSPALLGAPGRYRPPSLSSPRRPLDERGLLLVLRFESMSATYAPADRASAPGDPSTRRDLEARVVGAGLNYYAGRHAAVLLHYTTTIFPRSSVPQLSPSNLAVAPGNLVGHSGAHQLHEIGARAQVFF